MFRIALCDDDKEELKKTYVSLQDYLQRHPELAARVLPFASGTELLEQAGREGGFDLYLLDVIMPGCDGIQTGKKLRELGGDGEIIYLTTSSDYAVDSYNVRAFFYLLKPVEQERLFQVLDAAVQTLNRRRTQSILVSTASGSQRILLDHILYVERVGRGICYYCAEGPVDTQTIQVSFRTAVEPLLADRRFCLCGASFLLNMERVVKVEGASAQLDNGKRVPLPRSAVPAFKRAWGRFWLGEQDK